MGVFFVCAVVLYLFNPFVERTFNIISTKNIKNLPILYMFLSIIYFFITLLLFIFLFTA